MCVRVRVCVHTCIHVCAYVCVCVCVSRWCNYTILISAHAHISLLTKCCNNDSSIIPMNTPNCVLLVTRPVGVRSPDRAHYYVKILALYITDCVSLCLSDETLKAVGPFYLVYMPGEVKYPTSLHWRYVTCR